MVIFSVTITKCLVSCYATNMAQSHKFLLPLTLSSLFTIWKLPKWNACQGITTENLLYHGIPNLSVRRCIRFIKTRISCPGEGGRHGVRVVEAPKTITLNMFNSGISASASSPHWDQENWGNRIEKEKTLAKIIVSKISWTKPSALRSEELRFRTSLKILYVYFCLVFFWK